MILFVSDMHFGRDAPEAERASERDLVACLRTYEAEAEHLYILGDLFDAYIEYRHLVPKGAVRVLALLADWVEHGIPVTYLVGNHDPWHRDYFRETLGVTVHMDAVETTAYGKRLYLHHGDGLCEAHTTYNRIKPWLRHSLPVWIYKNLLPGDVGMALAYKMAHQSAQNDRSGTDRLKYRPVAERLLAEHQVDTVVLGHTHGPEHLNFPEGEYVNLGAWYHQRTFAVLDTSGFHLKRWNGTSAVPVEASATPQAATP